MVRAGYVEYNTENKSELGVPQGTITSPILSNLILNELDRYIEQLQLENEKKNAGRPHTIRNPQYTKIDYRIQGINKLERK